ncbi:signal peptide peptidase SppA [Nannocystis radixulma]|uniref:Signal peptide peptidase SppA n=1 Tax=Nannocystis radixulma TaxID=2995305 RepID=A0ABT5BG96_9BACT|nr:signal peptide peptidase SppA [Nannocystis radixulma]MDC0673145.1 signal peptide peptidase SppA [Nannocystis radixulma]
MRVTRATTVLLSLATLCATACRGDRDHTPPPPEPAAKPDVASAPAATPPAAAGALGNLGPLSSMLADKLDAPGPYDPPRQSKDFDAGKPHWLTLDLGGEIGELAPMSLFGGGALIELHALLQRLDRLAADANVQGLLVRFTDVGLDMATAEEVRGAFHKFKDGGRRKLVCHADTPTNAVYYLMTACDSVGVQPVGEVMIPGPMAMPLHLRGLLDKLGVIPDFVHVGAFKGAAEPLTRTEPSKEMRETLSAVVDQAYLTMQTGIAAGRNMTPETAAQRIDEALFTSEGALAAGLVDSVATYEDFRTQHTSGAPWKQVKLKDSARGGGFDMEKLQAFLGLVPPKRPTEPHIALVYALGSIIDGRGQGTLGARQQIAGRTLAAAIDNLTDDANVAAILLRVDSGGGSAMASEQIWRALQRAKEKKPIIVSMGGVAASGGYYISCGATKIFALANTLTGSIGVVGGKIAVEGMLEKVGIRTFPIGKGKRAAMWSGMTPWTEGERATVLATMEEIYQVFLGRVASGRGKSPEEIHTIAQGRVWTGAAAKERGLVDELGGLTEALAEARKLTGVSAEVPLEVYPPEPTIKDIIEGFDTGPSLIRAAAEQQLVPGLGAALGPAGLAAVHRVLAQLDGLREQPIQTALIWPVLTR